jgi:hypothetical protein
LRRWSDKEQLQGTIIRWFHLAKDGGDIMRTLTPEQIDGRLNAHRKLLVALASYIAQSSEGRSFLESLLHDTEIVRDHEEDPGIEPDLGFAGQQIADDEMRAIVQAGWARATATTNQ